MDQAILAHIRSIGVAPISLEALAKAVREHPDLVCNAAFRMAREGLIGSAFKGSDWWFASISTPQPRWYQPVATVAVTTWTDDPEDQEDRERQELERQKRAAALRVKLDAEAVERLTREALEASRKRAADDEARAEAAREAEAREAEAREAAARDAAALREAEARAAEARAYGDQLAEAMRQLGRLREEWALRHEELGPDVAVREATALDGENWWRERILAQGILEAPVCLSAFEDASGLPAADAWTLVLAMVDRGEVVLRQEHPLGDPVIALPDTPEHLLAAAARRAPPLRTGGSGQETEPLGLGLIQERLATGSTTLIDAARLLGKPPAQVSELMESLRRDEGIAWCDPPCGGGRLYAGRAALARDGFQSLFGTLEAEFAAVKSCLSGLGEPIPIWELLDGVNRPWPTESARGFIISCIEHGLLLAWSRRGRTDRPLVGLPGDTWPRASEICQPEDIRMPGDPSETAALRDMVFREPQTTADLAERLSVSEVEAEKIARELLDRSEAFEVLVLSTGEFAYAPPDFRLGAGFRDTDSKKRAQGNRKARASAAAYSEALTTWRAGLPAVAAAAGVTPEQALDDLEMLLGRGGLGRFERAARRMLTKAGRTLGQAASRPDKGGKWARKRAKALRALKQPSTVSAFASALGLSRLSASDWLSRLHRDGDVALSKVKPPGVRGAPTHYYTALYTVDDLPSPDVDGEEDDGDDQRGALPEPDAESMSEAKVEDVTDGDLGWSSSQPDGRASEACDPRLYLGRPGRV